MRLPVSSRSNTTTHATTANSMGVYGTKNKNTGSIAGKKSSIVGASTTTTKHNDSSHTNSTSNSSRRSFKGRNAFRKTLMLRKANHSSSNNGSQKGPTLLRSSFTSSDDPEHLLAEQREANSPTFASQPSRTRTTAALVNTLQDQEAAKSSPLPPATFPKNRPPASSSSPSSKTTPLPQASPSTTTTSNSTAIPIAHVETILRVFGDNDSFDPLDLYRDVLDVSPEASERDVRIAYFRRGREVLSAAGINGDTNEATAVASGVMDPATRTKFQAVSMAYEILSNPAWKQQYLENGGLVMPSKAKNSLPKHLSVVTPNADKTITLRSLKVKRKLKAQTNALQKKSPEPTTKVAGNRPMSALRESSFRSGVRTSLLLTGRSHNSLRSSSVRWSEHVEELVFDHDPNEHVVDDDDDYDDSEDEEKDHNEMIRDFLLIGEPGRASNASPPSSSSFFEEEEKEDTLPDRSSPATSTLASSVTTFIGKRKKNKPRVIIESDELESHLKRMDNEAEKHFVQDFFDTFEESMSGVLSIVDSFADAKTKPYKPSKNVKPKGVKGLIAGLDRSMSHDTADLERAKEKNKAAASPASPLDGDVDGLVKRSKSFPQPTTERTSVGSPNVAYDDSMNASSQMAEAPGSFVVTPDAHVRRSMSNAIHASRDPQPGPAVVSPVSVHAYPASPTLAGHKISGKTTPAQSSRSGKFFRPISPSPSEASDLLTTRSDQFDLESLAMSELENPFRESSTHPEALATSQNAEDSSIVSDSPKQVDQSFDSSGAKTMISTSPTPAPVKSKKVSISMVSTIHEVAAGEPPSAVAEERKQRMIDRKKNPEDDVFEGLDETGQRATASKNKGHIGLSIQRSNSMAASDCLSDLSESVWQYNMAVEPPKPRVQKDPGSPERNQDQGRDTPASEVSDATTLTSNIASPRRSVYSTRSESSVSSAGDPFSAMDLLTAASMGDGSTVHSAETAMEANGFFEYFVSYVSAIVTECTSTESSGHGFGKDIISIFASGSQEEREPPANIPSMGSSVTSIED